MADDTQLSQLQDELNALRKTSNSHFKSLETGIIALKRKLTSLVVTLQQKHQEKEVTSSNLTRGQDQALIPAEDVQTQSIRLDFLVFYGEDPIRWLYKVQKFFTFYNTLSQHKLRLASFHMECQALVGFQDMDEFGQFVEWDQIVKHPLVRFEPHCYDNPMESLTRLMQMGSVVEYKAIFESLSNRLRGLSDEYKLSCFLSGLREDIRLTIRMFNPTNILLAYSLAKLQEEDLIKTKKTCQKHFLPFHSKPNSNPTLENSSY